MYILYTTYNWNISPPQEQSKRMDGLKRFTRLLKVTFILVFIFHFSSVSYYIMYPTTPGIRVYKTTLDNTFPISLLICAHQLQNESARYEKVGYPDNIYFYYGTNSKYNKSLLGWHGHTENGSSIGYVEGRLMEK